MDELDTILATLELKQLFTLRAKIQKQINEKSALLPRLDLNKIMHEALNQKTVLHEQV